MSTPGPRAIPADTVNVDESPAPGQARTAVDPNRPEWTTARWKLQVEAEARNRLKKSIRNIGSER
jgi:hypothetical protein